MKGRNMDNRTSIGPGAIHEDFAAVSDVFGAEIEDPHSLYREYRKSQPVMEGDILARFNVPSQADYSNLGRQVFTLFKYQDRSEERRVGKEWVSPCRSGWSPG